MSDLSESLLSLGETKLAIQATTSIGYDTQALGLMAVAVALASVNVALMGDLGAVWWLPLPSLTASLGTSIAAISQPTEIETGQNLKLTMNVGATIEEQQRLLLENIADAIDINTGSLAGKRAMVSLATTLIGIAFALLGTAQLLTLI